MTHDESKNQIDEQTKPEASTDSSLSDADLEQVAGGYSNGYDAIDGRSARYYGPPRHRR